MNVESFETLRVRKDGTVFPVLLAISPVRDADGAIVGGSTITRDMTQEKEAFDAARSMIESSLDALVAISPEGLITDANEATVKATGIPRVELIGTGSRSVLPTRRRPRRSMSWFLSRAWRWTTR